MGLGLGRPLLRLGLTEDVSVEAVGDVGDVGDSEKAVGEIGGVLPLVVGDASSVWRSSSLPCCADVTWGSKEKVQNSIWVRMLTFPCSMTCYVQRCRA